MAGLLGGVRSILVGTAAGATQASGVPHTCVATVGVVAMLASWCACYYPTIILRRAFISAAMFHNFVI